MGLTVASFQTAAYDQAYEIEVEQSNPIIPYRLLRIQVDFKESTW